MKNRLILILAIHRTLSGCLAECLEWLGVWMGATTHRGEDEQLALLCEREMPFPSTRMRGRTAERVSARSRELLAWYEAQRALTGPAPIGAKYPHLCAWGSEFAKCEKAGLRLKIINLERPIEESIESLVDRSLAEPRSSPWYATREQCRRLERVLADAKRSFLAGRRYLTVQAHDLLRDPGRELARVVDYLGLRPTAQQFRDAVAHVDPAKAVHASREVTGYRLQETGDRAESIHPLSPVPCSLSPIPCPLSPLSAGITSFLRFECVRNLLDSIDEHAPGLVVHVVDDSLREGEEYPAEARAMQARQNVRWHRMPFDSGLAAKRNRIVAECRTPYCLILDDDFLLIEETHVERYQEILDADPEIDVIYGAVRFDGRTAQRYLGRFEWLQTPSGRQAAILPGHPAWKCVAGVRYTRSEIVNNCLCGRRDKMLACPWDETFLVVHEHPDWCFEAKRRGLRIAYTPDVIFDHMPLPSSEYGTFRGRTFARELADKWRIDRDPAFLIEAEPAAPEYRDLTIPKTLHQIWIGPDRLPAKYAAFIARWKALHPGWGHRLWGNELLDRVWPGYRWLVDGLEHPALKSDFLRYWLLYVHGGVYLDVDFEPFRPIDELLAACQAFAVRAGSDAGGTCCNGFLGSTPRHPFIADVIRTAFVRADPKDPMALGPRLITEIVRRRDDVRVIEGPRLMPVSWPSCRHGLLEAPQQYAAAHAVHHFAASWVAKRE